MMNTNSQNKIINKDLIVIIALNIALALVSFLKDTLLASYLGTTGSADTLFAAFFLPDAIGFNILGQTASLVLVPVFVTLLSGHKRKEALGTAYIVSFAFIVISFITSLVFLAGDGYTLMGIISGRDNVDKTQLLTLMSVFIPILYIIPIAYICIAYLNAQNRFKITAIAPLIYNAFILFAVVICMVLKIPYEKGIILIAISISLASLIMAVYLFNMAGAFKNRPLIRNCLEESFLYTGKIRKLVNQAVYFILIFTLYQSVLYFERFVANKISLGGVSALNYSYRLAQFPLWVFISALLVVILPDLSRNIAIENYKGLYSKLHNAWLILLLFITPVAALLFILRKEVLSLVFLRGAFGLDSLELTSQIMAGYSLSIIFQSFSYLLLRVYLVYGKMEKAFIAYLVSSVINIAFDFATYRYLGLWVIGIGAVLGWLANMLLLYFLGEREMKRQILTKEPRIPIIIIGSNIFASLTGLFVKEILEKQVVFPGYTLQVLLLAVACSFIYLTVYALILMKFKIIQKILG
ncbi:MAG: lipid II flippase MurJ [Herbinix sp.]|nr:lipid II flippase MurJ [Herbinix sp.]